MFIVFGNFVEVIGVWPLLKPSTRFLQRIEDNSRQNWANKCIIVVIDFIHFFKKYFRYYNIVYNAATLRFWSLTSEINVPFLDIIYLLFHQKKPSLSHYAISIKQSWGNWVSFWYINSNFLQIRHNLQIKTGVGISSCWRSWPSRDKEKFRFL